MRRLINLSSKNLEQMDGVLLRIGVINIRSNLIFLLKKKEMTRAVAKWQCFSGSPCI